MVQPAIKEIKTSNENNSILSQLQFLQSSVLPSKFLDLTIKQKKETDNVSKLEDINDEYYESLVKEYFLTPVAFIYNI